MSNEQAILKWLERLHDGQEKLVARVGELTASLATCQAKHAGERKASLLNNGKLVKALALLATAAAGAIASHFAIH